MLVTKKGWLIMLYPFMTLNDGTEIVHSETLEEAGKEKVEVRIEKPVYGGFHSATCWLPEYNGKILKDFRRKIFNIFRNYWNPLPISFYNRPLNTQNIGRSFCILIYSYWKYPISVDTT